MNELFGNIPSIVKNPFNKTSIKSINLTTNKGIFGNIYYNAYISFENGNTRGEQKFECTDLADAFIKAKEFCEQLED